MTVFRNSVFATFLLLLGGILLPPTVGAQTLTDALIAAYSTSPQFQADHARQNALDEDVARAAGGWLPQAAINGEIGYGRERQYFNYIPLEVDALGDTNASQRRQLGSIRPHSLSAQIVQPIYDGGKTIADVNRSESAVKAGQAHAGSVEQAVLGGALQSYYDLYRDQAILTLTKGDVTALDKVKDATKKLFGIHDVTMTDVAQADSRLARGIAGQASAEGSVAASVSAFTLATGLTPGSLPPPDVTVPTDLMPSSLSEATSLALQSPAVREAEQAVQTAQADVDYAASAFKPTISLQLSSSYSNEISQSGLKQYYNEGAINLQIPIAPFGAAPARVREAKSILVQRKFEADQARRDATDRVRHAWEQLIAARTRIESLKKQVESANIARNSMEAERRVGSRTIIDQLNTEQDWLDAQISLVQAEHDAAISEYAVLNAIGRLSARTLHLPVRLYNPETHYKKESGRWFGTGIPDEDDPILDSSSSIR